MTKKASKKPTAPRKKTVEAIQEELLDIIDVAGGPDNMSKRGWRDLLKGLIFDLQVRLEAVEGELADDDE